MKRKIFSNLAVISFFILFVWIIVTTYQYLQWHYNYIDIYNKVKSSCDPSSIVCKDLIKPYIPDTVVVFFIMLTNYSLNYVQLLSPLLVIIPSIWDFHSELKSGMFKNILNRKNYFLYLRDSYLRALSNIWILPIFVITLFLISFIISRNFDFEKSKLLYDGVLPFDVSYLKNIFFFGFVYLTNIVLHSIFFVNIGLIYCKKSSNIFITVMYSYVTYIFIQLFLEIFVSNLLLSKILHLRNLSYSLSLFNVWTYVSVVNLQFYLLFSVTITLVSLLILFLKYKDKESVIIENEK